MLWTLVNEVEVSRVLTEMTSINQRRAARWTPAITTMRPAVSTARGEKRKCDVGRCWRAKKRGGGARWWCRSVGVLSTTRRWVQSIDRPQKRGLSQAMHACQIDRRDGLTDCALGRGGGRLASSPIVPQVALDFDFDRKRKAASGHMARAGGGGETNTLKSPPFRSNPFSSRNNPGQALMDSAPRRVFCVVPTTTPARRPP
jgi:hypothetical protein